jgi:3-hydroxyisobutyrate dehydrogenase-like beta-hydroxyacid dehydrogenase
VPGRGLRTPMAASGAGAPDFAAALTPFGAVVDVLPEPVGAAARRKLLRSVFFKGLAACVLEALAAGREAGLEGFVREQIITELVTADAATLTRLVEGSRAHAVRRADEMEAARQLLAELGVPARVATASRDWLRELAAQRAAD